MPLIHSKSKKDIGKNIEIEKHAHPEMPNAQAAAIAYSTARQAGAKLPKNEKQRHPKDSSYRG